MKRIAFGLVVAVALLSFACTDDEPSSPSGSSTSGGGATQGSVSSCDLTADVGYCLDFEASAPKDEAKNNCLGANRTAGYNGVANETGSCPTASRVGTCVYTTVNGVKTTYRYYAPKFTAGSAETNCKAVPNGPGAFTAN